MPEYFLKCQLILVKHLNTTFVQIKEFLLHNQTTVSFFNAVSIKICLQHIKHEYHVKTLVTSHPTSTRFHIQVSGKKVRTVFSGGSFIILVN